MHLTMTYSHSPSNSRPDGILYLTVISRPSLTCALATSPDTNLRSDQLCSTPSRSSRAKAAFEVDGEKIGELCAEPRSPSRQ